MPQESLTRLEGMFGEVCDRLWERTDTYWHRGEFERCIALMRLITRIDPHDIQAYDDGAWLMQNQLRDDEAEAFLREGLGWNHDSYDLYFSLGYFYYNRLRFDEATRYLETAVTFEVPHFVWHQLAHANEQAGRTGDALCIWLMLEAKDADYAVPRMQAERILRGEPPSQTPYAIYRSHEERKAEQGQ